LALSACGATQRNRNPSKTTDFQALRAAWQQLAARRVLLRNTCLALSCAQTLEKKAFAHTPGTKKCLRKRAGVLFFAAIGTRATAARDDTTFEE